MEFSKSQSLLNGSRNTVSSSVLKTNLVMKFDGYFKETVNEAITGEAFRVRTCHILYYIENDSLEIVEHKHENSGMPQGNFLKRHTVDNVRLGNIEVGGQLEVYGRIYFINGCNDSTRTYLQKQGRQVGRNTSFPEDPYEAQRSKFMERETGADSSISRNQMKSPMKKFAEATLGNTVNNNGRAGHEKYDRKVLQFESVWDDRNSMYGQLTRYTLQYYLTDNTVEVLEVAQKNSGRDPFPKLLKRQLLKRSWDTNNMNGRGDEDKDEHYSWEDFSVGSFVNVFARNLQIVDANQSTYAHFEQQGLSMRPPIDVEAMQGPKQVVERQVPPHNGWGTDADSMGSVMSLIPKAPKTEFDQKGPALSQQVLSFAAKLTTGHPDDSGRDFCIQFFVADNTIKVREPPKRNTGIIGGNFLARKKWSNPATGKFFVESDFFVGATAEFQTKEGYGYGFTITDVDEATLKYMEGKPSSFPLADITQVMEMIVSSSKDSIRESFRKHDKDYSGNLTVDEFTAMLTEVTGQDVNPQVKITLMRKFDHDGNGKIDYQEFQKGVEQVETELDEHHGQAQNELGAGDSSKYLATANAVQQEESDAIAIDKLLSQFTDKFIDRGTMSQQLLRLAGSKAKDGTSVISRGNFIRGVAEAESVNDSDAMNIYFGLNDANRLANAFFGIQGAPEAVDTLSIAEMAKKIGALNLSSGTRGHQGLR